MDKRWSLKKRWKGLSSCNETHLSRDVDLSRLESKLTQWKTNLSPTWTCMWTFDVFCYVTKVILVRLSVYPCFPYTFISPAQ